jgi:FMN phosphatase YigB (HAD superfamily)
MVGDSLEHDVLAPQRAGLQAVWFNERGKHPAPAIAVPAVTSLVELARLVESAG